MLPIKNLADQKKDGNPTLNMIIYGDSGVGKTTLAASAAELGKVLYVDAEAGAKFIDDKLAKDIDMLQLNDVQLLDQILIPQNVAQYNTIVLDSVTEIMKKMIDFVKGTKEEATIKDWGKIISKMEGYFRSFRDLNKNVILVALTTEKEDDGVILKRPSLSGKNLPADTIGFMDVCLYLENTVQGRVGHTSPTQKFYAKDRTGKLPVKIEQKDLTIKFIFDNVTTKPKPVTAAQKKKINEGIKILGLKDEEIVKMANYGGAMSLDELTYQGAEKVIKGLEIKLSHMAPKDESVK